MKKYLCGIWIVALLLTCMGKVSGQDSSVSFDFVMQDIRDIVYAVSIAQGLAITCDDTITGKASFRFSGADFDQAAQAFLLSNRLYARMLDGVIVLSKVDIRFSKGSVQTRGGFGATFDVDAYDTLPSVLFNKISQVAGLSIVYELLPSSVVSVHIQNATIEELVSVIMQAFPGYAVSREEKNVSIRKSPLYSPSAGSGFNTGNADIRHADGAYELNIEQGSFFESLEKLFDLSGADFCNLLGDDSIITRLVYSDDNFDESLKMLCAQGGADFTFSNGMYVLYGVHNADDALKNANKSWKTLALKFLSADTYVSLVRERFPLLKPLILSDTLIQFELSASDFIELSRFTAICDVPEKTRLVQLQYIRTKDFLDHVPPGIRTEQLTDTGSGHNLFFTGTDEAYTLLQKSLEVLDRPATSIRYDLLVLQVQESEAANWKLNSSINRASIGDSTGLGVHLGSVLALNLDVVTAFGYSFAAELQTAIGENRAEIFADTRLQGLSGSPINFQNTNTFRYQDTAIDPDTGEPVYSGITREIIAGLVLNIQGWVSGDGMVTTKVTASLSRRGADVSKTGNPPPTSEKIVTTEVRGGSGEPIILSGLVQNDFTLVEEGVPFISKIPILGWLFKSHQKTEEKTEMIIYLVPHVESPAIEGVYNE